MEWREEAVVLGVRRLGETSVIAELMTRTHGRVLGVVRGGRSRQMRAVLQPGNTVDAAWRARLDEQMGAFVLEPVALRAAALMEAPFALHAVQLLAAHLRLLPERDPHARLHDALLAILAHIEDPARTGILVLRFEAALLEELGFGLDLDRCALTGARDGLAYVSPRTGRAVTEEAGRPWKEQLLALPALLLRMPDDSAAAAPGLDPGFALVRHFLARDVWAPRGLEEPASRAAFVSSVLRLVSDA